MKFIVSSSELLKGLLTVSKALPSKTTEAILEDYLFSLNGDVLEVTASDKEITMKTTIAVESKEGDGRIAVLQGSLTISSGSCRTSRSPSGLSARTSSNAPGQAESPLFLISTRMTTRIARPQVLTQ